MPQARKGAKRLRIREAGASGLSSCGIELTLIWLAEPQEGDSRDAGRPGADTREEGGHCHGFVRVCIADRAFASQRPIYKAIQK